MIFIGDIASPTADTCEKLKALFSDRSGVFADKKVICNLEGLIDGSGDAGSRTPVLYNHPQVTESLITGRSPVFCLANNSRYRCEALASARSNTRL